MLNYSTDFFQTHSIKYIEMALRTDRIKKITDPDGYGTRTGDCGDTVEFFLKSKNSTIESSSFLVQGCMNTTACCNTVAKFIQGKTIETAWKVSPEKINKFLQTLPLDSLHLSASFHCQSKELPMFQHHASFFLLDIFQL